MTTLFLTHDDGLRHETPGGHPERAERLAAIKRALSGSAFDALRRQEAPRADPAEVLRCHPASYLERIRAAVPAEGWGQLDADTFVSPRSLDAALRSVGGAEAAVDAVLAGRAQNAFVAMRPPGHHAERDIAMGFCLFGTVSIAAKYALDHHGIARVAVLDFDVHHGNGTQDLLWDEQRAIFVSSHQMPLYPGTGAAHERGIFGQIVNLPLRPGSDGAQMRHAWEPALDRVAAFAPELVLISAGFDAHDADPLGGLAWREDDFIWLTAAICRLARDCCAGRVVSVLEGGYDLDALAASVAAHVGVLMEQGE
ncbi:MAG: histone deacetylase family protein [Defluviimonas sp.]|uniref:histone deacetylase family protein n=1 Tax=Albidovulum sp. TaxID=1872424 RepID=UPI002A30FED1|nr:histone deacetylase family protein [Defluviimonas sp.]